MTSFSKQPTRGERVIGILMAGASWYFFFVYFSVNYLKMSLIGYVSYVAFLLILLVTSLVLRRSSSKYIGISLILPFSIVSFSKVFLSTFYKMGGTGDLFISIGLVALEIAPLIVFLRLIRKNWANYTVTFIFLGATVYGIMEEGIYFSNYTIYYISLALLVSSVIFLDKYHYSGAWNSFRNFFTFGTGKYIKYIQNFILATVIIFLSIGTYLLSPFNGSNSLNLYISYVITVLTLGSLLFFINLQSAEKLTGIVTFIVIAGVSIYGLQYVISLIPSYALGGGFEYRSILWLGLSIVLLYEPTFTLAKESSNIELDLSLVNMENRLRRRTSWIHGRYETIKHIADGGSANVYKYRVMRGKNNLITVNQEVIIKVPVLKCESCKNRMESIPDDNKCTNVNCRKNLDIDNFKAAIISLEAEMDALKHLDHPNIVKQIEHFKENGKEYLVEEFVPGETFASRFSGRPVNENEMVGIVRKILMTINYAHTHGFIHRDLNIGNIMLLTNDEIKIIDFGTAKFKMKKSEGGKGLPSSNALWGTDNWSPPESYYSRLIMGREPSPSYDIYSIGCIMFFMLLGKIPNELNSTTVSTIYPNRRHREDFVKELSKANITKHTFETILKATSFYPEDRYQSAFEMLCDIDRKSGKFLVTKYGYAYELPAIPGQDFNVTISVKYKNEDPFAGGSQIFSKIGNGLNIDIKRESDKRQSEVYLLTFEETRGSYQISTQSSHLYVAFYDLNNILKISQIKTGFNYKLERPMLFFLTTNSLYDVVFAYYLV
jgi:serine/threonine protein kinase